MILELTNDKKPKSKTSKETLDLFRDLFLKNKDCYIYGYTIELLTHKKGVRKFINLLRWEGMPIISNYNGYKYSTNKEEIKECYEKLRIRALRTYSAAKKMKMNL